jgi:hypothetical protein
MAAWFHRRDRADAAFVVVAVVAAAVILRLGLGLTFFADEWAYIETRSLGDPTTWFTPHNEHWNTLPILAYRLLVETVGLGSYVPYLALVLALHLVVAALVFVLARRMAGPVVGLAAAVIVLFLGSGFENLFWGFQTQFVGAVAAGLGALVVLDGSPTRGRVAAGIGLLIAGLMTSGVGVTFVVIVAVELLVDRGRRRLLPLLVIPVAIYLIWFATVGRSGIATVRNPFTLDAILDAPSAVVAGFGNATGAVVGVGPVIGGWLGLIGLTVVLAWAAISLRGPRLARFLGCLAGIVTQYALIGILRASVVEDVTNYTRYTYVSAVLLIVGLTAVIGPIWTSGVNEGTVPSAPTRRRLALLAGGSLFAMALVWNVRLLVDGRALFGDRAAMTRALVTVGLERPLPPETDPDRSLVLVPSPVSLERIVARYGSPLGDSLAPESLAAIPPEVGAEALRRLREGATVPLPEEVANP